VHQLFTRLLLAVRVYRERRALALLDAHTLRDLGLCRSDVIAESARPFWDLPPERTWS
jgi:uncharacterized protein YjiS (DUF1127 family)